MGFKKLMSKLPDWYGLLGDWVPMAALVSGIFAIIVQIYYIFWLDKPYYEDFADFELLYGRYVVPSYAWLISLFLDGVLAFMAGYLIMSIMKVSERGVRSFVSTHIIIYLHHTFHWIWFLIGWWRKDKQNAWWSDSKSERPTLNHINMMLMLWLVLHGFFLTVINSYYVNMGEPEPRSSRSDESMSEVIHTSGDTIVDIVTPRKRSKKRSKSGRRAKSRRSRRESDSSDNSLVDVPKHRRSRSLGGVTVAPVHKSRGRNRSKQDRATESPTEAALQKTMAKVSKELKEQSRRRSRSLTSEPVDDDMRHVVQRMNTSGDRSDRKAHGASVSFENTPRNRSPARNSRRSVTVALVNEATGKSVSRSKDGKEREAGGRSTAPSVANEVKEEPPSESKRRSKEKVKEEKKAKKASQKKEKKDSEAETPTEADREDSCQGATSLAAEIIQALSCSSVASGVSSGEPKQVVKVTDSPITSETLKRKLKEMDRKMNAVTHKMKSKACERTINEAIRKTQKANISSALGQRVRESLSVCSQMNDSTDSDGNPPDGSQSDIASLKSRLKTKIKKSNESILKASRRTASRREAAGRSRRSTVDMRHAHMMPMTVGSDTDLTSEIESLKSKLRSTIKKSNEAIAKVSERAAVGREATRSKTRMVEPAASATRPSILRMARTPSDNTMLKSNLKSKKTNAAMRIGNVEDNMFEDVSNAQTADTKLGQILSRMSNATSSAYTLSDGQTYDSQFSASDSYVQALKRRIAAGKSKSKSIDLSAIKRHSSTESRIGVDCSCDSNQRHECICDSKPKKKKVKRVKSTTPKSSDLNPNSPGTKSRQFKTESKTRQIRSDSNPREIRSDSSKPRLIRSDSSVPRTTYSSDGTAFDGSEVMQPRSDKRRQKAGRSRSLADEIIRDISQHTFRSRASDVRMKHMRSVSDTREKAGASSPSRKRTSSRSKIRKPSSKTKVKKSSGKTSTDEETETGAKPKGSKKAVITISGSRRPASSKVPDSGTKKKSSSIRVKEATSKSKTRKPSSDTKLRKHRSQKRVASSVSSDDTLMDLPKKKAASSSEKVKTSDSNTSESAQLKRKLSNKLAHRQSKPSTKNHYNQYYYLECEPVCEKGRPAGGRSKSRPTAAASAQSLKSRKSDKTNSTQSLKTKKSSKSSKSTNSGYPKLSTYESESTISSAAAKSKRDSLQSTSSDVITRSNKTNIKTQMREASKSSRETGSETSETGSIVSSDDMTLDSASGSSSMDASIQSGTRRSTQRKILVSKPGLSTSRSKPKSRISAKPMVTTSSQTDLTACQVKVAKPASTCRLPETDPTTMACALIRPLTMDGAVSNASKKLLDSALSLATLTSQIKVMNEASKTSCSDLCAPKRTSSKKCTTVQKCTTIPVTMSTSQGQIKCQMPKFEMPKLCEPKRTAIIMTDEVNRTTFPMPRSGNAGACGSTRVLTSNPPCGPQRGGPFPVQPPTRQQCPPSSQSRGGFYQMTCTPQSTYSSCPPTCPPSCPPTCPPSCPPTCPPSCPTTPSSQRGGPFTSRPPTLLQNQVMFNRCPPRAGGSKEDIYSLSETTSTEG